MKKILNLFSLLLFLTGSLTAQQNNNTTPTGDANSASAKTQSLAVSNAIQKFKTSEFMVRFSDFKTQMETDVRDFIGRQNSYSIKDVRRVQIAYDKTAAKFNQIMLEIKQDFMDKEKVKMINKFPDMYVNGLKGKIDGLEDFYRANFNQTLESVTEGGGSAILLATLLELIKAAGDLSQHFKTLKFEKEYMNDQYIQQNLVEPSKLPTWAQMLANTPIKTDVKMHPSRLTTTGDNGGNNNGGNNNGGNNNGGNNNGGNNNGGNNNGGNNNGGNSNGDNNNGGNNNGGNNNGGNSNGDNNNGGNNNGGNNNGGNNNGGNNNGGNDSGGHNNANNTNGKSFNDGNIEPKTPQFGVEGASTLEIQPKVSTNSPGEGLKKKTTKPNTPN